MKAPPTRVADTTPRSTPSPRESPGQRRPSASASALSPRDRLQRARDLGHDMTRPAAYVRPAPAGLVQPGRFQVFIGDGKKNLALDENEQLMAAFIAEDLDSIVEAAVEIVDSEQGTTNSALAYYNDTGSKAKAAKRGSAIHAESYLIIGDQMKGWGASEVTATVGKGRMDLLVTLPSGKKVVYDITSHAQAQKKHSLGRGYQDDKAVAMMYEISYDDF